MSLACLAILFGFSSTSYAQKQLQDSLRVFEEPLQLESGGKDLIGYSEQTFEFLKPSDAKRLSIAEAQKLGVPSNTHRVVPTIMRTYKHQNYGMCWRFTCGANCSRCFILWFDLNGDGKVTPSYELRCINLKGESEPMYVRRIECE